MGELQGGDQHRDGSSLTSSHTVQGCTAEIFKCHQIRVTYAPKLLFTESRDVADFAESDWAHLTRYSAVCVVTGELSTNIREVSQ